MKNLFSKCHRPNRERARARLFLANAKQQRKNGHVHNFFWGMLLCCLLLQGCAQSAVSREAESQVDKGFMNMEGGGRSSLSGTYQNTTQTTKGMILGGAGGAVAGGLISGVGVLPGAGTGAILGGALGAYIDHYTTLGDKLENRHVKVINLGDQVMIVIPSNEIFDGTTPYLVSSAYSTLNLVAQLISTYPNMSVEVAAYTPAVGCSPINSALSREQANAIVKYLWRTGINTRLLYGVGKDGAKQVSNSALGWNGGENYRIEITLEKLPI